MIIADNSFHLDRSRNATIQIFEHLRELIVSMVLAPGSVLPRRELCAYYGLSLSPVRDALLRLEDEYLVDIYPQHQTRVRCIDLGQARQIHLLRLSAELQIATVLAQRANPALGTVLLDLVKRQRSCLETRRVADLARLSTEFQHRMYTAAGMPDVRSILRSRSGNLDRLRMMHRPTRESVYLRLEQQGDLAMCIGDGAVEAARRAVENQLGSMLRLIDSLIGRYPDRQLPLDYLPDPVAA